jgi:hypothetical protein
MFDIDRPLVLLEIVILFLVFLSLASVAYLFVWGIVKAASYPPPAVLVVSLSLLTFFAIVAAFLSDSPELVTLAATGIGALAGAVSSQYDSSGGRKTPTDVKDTDHDRNEPGNSSSGGDTD